MLEAQPLCTGLKSHLREEVWVKQQRAALLLYQTEVDTAGSCPEKLCVPAWRDLVRSVIAVVKNKVVGKNQDVCRACTPLNWHHMVS